MESKNGKQYLPQTYEQFQQQRKKGGKQANLLHRQSLEPNMNNYLAYQKQDRKERDRKAYDSDEEVVECEIVEKVIHSDYQNMLDNFEKSKFSQISNKIENQMNKLKEQAPIQIVSINTILKDLSIQSLENIKNISFQLEKSPGRRNLQKIDLMLSFNKFFVILNRQKRYKIYDHCQFQQVEEGEEIYQEGLVDDFMYVVVKGCIKQYEKKITSFNEKVAVNFISHYEGSNFGEAQLIGDKNEKSKRHHTTIATEKSYLLKISNQFYRELITHSVEDDFEKKLTALLSTSIFSETSKIFVTPLLSTLQKHILNLGDVLSRQGEQTNKLYFLAQGNLQIVFIGKEKRNVKHLNIEKKPVNFQMKSRSTKGKGKQKNFSIHETFYYPKEESHDNKEFLYGNKKIVNEDMEYNDHIVFAELRTGDFLGGKSFLTPQQRERKALNSQFFSASLKSKLSVISSSIQTIVYSIDEKKFFSLSDNLQKVIVDGIISNPYFDERDIECKVSGQKEWKKYSQNLVAQVITEKKNRNKSFRN